MDLATLFTLLPIIVLLYNESLTNRLHFRWDVPIKGLTLSNEYYRSEMFKDASHTCCFVVWTLQVIVSLGVVYFHITRPHHPKFYSTWKDRIAIFLHIIGGTLGVNGFYFGALLNIKLICFVAAAAGIGLHLPTVLWNKRQTHGQREMSAPTYFMVSVFLLQSYVDFYLYDANFQTVFSCAMTLNIYGMVRFYYFMGRHNLANLETSYDRTLFFAGFSNICIARGMFASLFFLFGFYLWNIYFNLIKPFPKFMMRIERGYWDVIPNDLEEKRGTTFEEELQRQMESGEGKMSKKEAIAKSLWKMIVGGNDKTMMEIKDIIELYDSWGIIDAESAAKSTFKKVDLDKNESIDYDEFKKGFVVLIDGIYIMGEYEDTYRQRQSLAKSQTKNFSKQGSYPFTHSK